MWLVSPWNPGPGTPWYPVKLTVAPERGKKYTVLQDGGLVKGYPWMIWLIIDTTHPAFRESGLVGAWRVVYHKWSSNKARVLGLGSPYHQQSRGRWCAWVWISPHPRTLHWVTTLSVSESAVLNNGKVGNQVLCPHSRCFGSYVDVIFLILSSTFWLFFQTNLINHPHRPSLANI